MTIPYSDNFVRVLFIWRGSVWKSVLLSYLVFLTLFLSLNLTYRYVLSSSLQVAFEEIVLVVEKWAHVIPIQFLLGFYVNSVFSRWWNQVTCIAWPDKFLMLVTANLQTDDENSRIMRLTFARYCNLVTVLVWREISSKVHKRFPTDGHLVQAGLLTNEELVLYEATNPVHGRWYVPISWMLKLLCRCRSEELVSDSTLQRLVDELHAFRLPTQRLVIYDWISIPMVYTQLVALATYGYFAFCLLSRQKLINETAMNHSDFIFPIFTSLEFVFYVGWLKVGESLRRPFGDDDEDVDLNYVIDRNWTVSRQIVDSLNQQRPALVKDKFWEDAASRLPHTKASHKTQRKYPKWSLHKHRLNEKDMAVFHNAHSHHETQVHPALATHSHTFKA